MSNNTSRGVRRTLLWPDTHAPYHDERAVRLLEKLPEFDQIVVLGDFLDCGTVSKHDPSPDKLRTLPEEIAIGKRLLARAAKKAPKRVYINGNHEYRLEGYIARRAPDLLGLVPSIAEQLDPRGEWTKVAYGDFYKVGRVFVTHDQGHAGIGAALKTKNLVGHSVAIGHTHRLEQSYSGHITGERHVAISCGWLGDGNAPVFRYAKPATRAHWQLGFATIEEYAGETFVTPHPIVNYSVTYQGKRYAV